MAGNPSSSFTRFKSAAKAVKFQRYFRTKAVFASVLALVACTNDPTPGEVIFVEDWAGIVIADEPNATLVGEAILARNGTAGDAAAAMALAMTVTLPSRVGLGGGGVCLAFRREVDGETLADAIVFTPEPTPSGVVVPRMARGIAVLHARHGSQLWGDMVQPAENLARFGHAVSRAFATDLRDSDEFEATPDLLALYAKPDGEWVNEGDRIVQPGLAAALSGIGLRGGAYMNMGDYARRLSSQANAVGFPMTMEQIRGARPRVLEPIFIEVGSDRIILPPAPLASGQQTAAAYQRLDNDGWADADLEERVALVERFPKPLFAGLNGSDMAAGLVVGDRFGGAVACSFSLNRLFGTGVVAGDTGVLLAAPPTMDPQFLSLSPAIYANFINTKARLAISANGPQGPDLAAAALNDAVDARALRFAGPGLLGASLPQNQERAIVLGEGDARQSSITSEINPRDIVSGDTNARASFFFCPEGLRESGPDGDCVALSDPRGHGLAEILRN